MTSMGLRKIIQPMLGQIDDDAFARTRRQNVTSRHDQLLAGARQPGIDPRVHPNDFFRTQTVFRREIVQRVLIHRDDGLIFAHHRVVGLRQRIGGRLHELRAADSQQQPTCSPHGLLNIDTAHHRPIS
jgi:hypothetical protein